mmetsp:Transcript_19046/g.47735  ORF Transcript_19046/g.47735 Transcript_19046/m.47735 type:complete len:391 (+) Transcript_19046:346-1518(+)
MVCFVPLWSFNVSTTSSRSKQASAKSEKTSSRACPERTGLKAWPMFSKRLPGEAAAQLSPLLLPQPEAAAPWSCGSAAGRSIFAATTLWLKSKSTAQEGPCLATSTNSFTPWTNSWPSCRKTSAPTSEKGRTSRSSSKRSLGCRTRVAPLFLDSAGAAIWAVTAMPAPISDTAVPTPAIGLTTAPATPCPTPTANPFKPSFLAPATGFRTMSRIPSAPRASDLPASKTASPACWICFCSRDSLHLAEYSSSKASPPNRAAASPAIPPMPSVTKATAAPPILIGAAGRLTRELLPSKPATFLKTAREYSLAKPSARSSAEPRVLGNSLAGSFNDAPSNVKRPPRHIMRRAVLTQAGKKSRQRIGKLHQILRSNAEIRNASICRTDGMGGSV